MGKNHGVALIIIVVGVLANNIVYLQDLWFGQTAISLDSWKAYLGIIASLAIIGVGLFMIARSGSEKSGD